MIAQQATARETRQQGRRRDILTPVGIGDCPDANAGLWLDKYYNPAAQPNEPKTQLIVDAATLAARNALAHDEGFYWQAYERWRRSLRSLAPPTGAGAVLRRRKANVQGRLVIGLGAAIQKLSPATAAAMFLIYSALTGFTLSLIVFTYTTGTITAAFATTAVLFGVMSVVGFTTRADLTQFRTLAMFALIGLLIAMLINIFLRSSALDMVISFIGVILFIGLLAMDTQRLKIMAAAPEVQSDRNTAARVAILGALNLYLDVINLFLFLLRLLGGGRR